MGNNEINQKSGWLGELLTDATVQLSKTIDSFSDESFNQVPFKESWTAAQVTEHTLKALEGINQTVNASTQSTERDPEQYLNSLREMMENFEMKAKSAPGLLPGKEPMAKATVQNRLLRIREQMNLSIHSLDLSEICVTLEFPGIGYLTRFELISFAAFHTQRHIHQMKNIHKNIF